MSIVPGIQQDKVIQFVVDHHTKWKANRVQLERVWQECFFRAFSRWPGGGMIDQGRTDMEKYYHPMMENNVDTCAAQLLQNVAPSDNFISMISRVPEQQIKADNLNALLRWAHMKNNFRRELQKLVKQAIITGNAPWNVSWAVRKTSVPDQQRLADLEARIKASQDAGVPAPPMIIPQKPMVTYAGPDFFVTSIFDYVVDPWPEDPDRYTRMKRSFKSPDAIKAMGVKSETGYAVYENTENIMPANFAEASDTMKQQEKVSLGIATDYEGKDRVEIIECFGDIPVTFAATDTDAEETVILYNHVAVIANRNTLLRLEPLPFEHGMMPNGLYQLNPRPGEPYGSGLVERCIGLHDAILERFNQSIQAHAFAINPMFFYKPDGLFDPEEFESFPGALHAYNGDIPKPFEVPDKAMDGFHEVALLKADMSEAFGSITDMNTGGERSATETSIVASNGNARFAEISTELEATVTTIVRQEASLLQQLLSDQIWVRVTHPMTPMDQPQGRYLSREDILGEFDLYCIGMSGMSQAKKNLQMLIQITAGLMPMPAFQQRFDPVAYGSVVYELAGLKEAASRFWKTDAQIQQEQINAAILNQSGAAQSGAEGGTGSPAQQPGIPGVASLPGVPNAGTAQPHPAIGPGGLGGPESLPGRRPLSPGQGA